MARVKRMEVRCTNSDCAQWFRSPFLLGTDKFVDPPDAQEMYGIKTECPHCHSVVTFGLENMRVSTDEGGFLGNETNPSG